MRTEAPHPRPRYRNDAVFRSAERLLASQPKKPARRLPPRAIVFLLGLACGLGLAFWLLRPVRETGTLIAGANATTGTDYIGRKRLNLPLADAKPTFTAGAPSFANPSAEAAEPTPAPVETSAATSSASRTIATTPRPAARPTAALDYAPLGFFLTEPTTLIKLRGELHQGPAGRRTVEFELYIKPGRLSGSVEGHVTLADDRVRGEPFFVTGRWLNRTITLGETVKMTHGSSARPSAHSFVLEFPRGDEVDEIIGFWSHAGFNGTLVLKSALPLGWLSHPAPSKSR